MRKMLLTPLIVCMVALLSMLWMPAVHSAEPILVSGTWSWMAPSDFFTVERVADGNVFIRAVEWDEFEGTFEGTGEGVFTLGMHSNGYTTGRGRTLFTGTVLGRSGTLVVQWVGNTKRYPGWWWFKWMILSGTGELANLHGQGIGVGPGPAGLDEWGGVNMSGTIVFALD